MKAILLFIMVAALFSCNCLPQIPTQYLPANASCEAYLPNYLPYVSVFDNCQGGTLTQIPLPGTILSEANPWLTVTITAKDLGGRTDTEQFTAILDDGIAPEIIWDSIPGDSIPVAQKSDIDVMINSYVATRLSKGDTLSPGWHDFKMWFEIPQSNE